MNTQTLRFGRYTVLLASLGILLALAIAAHALTTLPTTLTGMLAVRSPIAACSTGGEVAATRTLRLTLAMDDEGHLGVQVAGTHEIAVRDGASGGAITSITVHPLAVVDTSVLFHRPVAPSAVGILVARISLPC
jgi:hypothetical protein